MQLFLTQLYFILERIAEQMTCDCSAISFSHSLKDCNQNLLELPLY